MCFLRNLFFKNKGDNVRDKFNNRYKKNQWVYNGRYLPGHKNVKLAMDVRSFIFTKDFILEHIVRENNLRGKNDDDTAYR